jgi:hypothetical protein
MTRVGFWLYDEMGAPGFAGRSLELCGAFLAVLDALGGNLASERISPPWPSSAATCCPRPTRTSPVFPPQLDDPCHE